MPDGVDPRLRSALARQFAARAVLLEGGATRVGWKLGMGDAERIGREIAVGYLTSATVVARGSVWTAHDAVGALHADAELALEIGRDVAPGADDDEARAAVTGYGAALEIVDLADASAPPESIVAQNVFHRAVAFGAFHGERPAGGTAARLIVGGQTRASASVDIDVAARVRAVARVLGAIGEHLRAGDRVITGSVVQVAIAPGDEVIADLGRLGQVAATIAAGARG